MMLRTGSTLALIAIGVIPTLLIAQVTPIAELGGPPVEEIAISPDGSTLAVANGDSVVQLLDAATFDRRRAIAAPGRTWTGVAWSPDGLELATAGGVPGDGAVGQWNPATGALVRELPFEGVGTDACYSADGSMLAAVGLAGTRGRLGVWTAATGAERFTLQLLDESIRVACAPNGSAVAVGFNGGNVRVFNSSDGSELLELTSGGYAHGLAYTPDGTRIIVGNGTALTVWDASSGALLHTVSATSAGIDSLAVSPDSSLILAGVTDLGVVAVDPVTGAEQWASHTVGPLDEATIAAIAFRSAGEALVYDNLAQPTEIDRISVRPARLDVAGATPLQVLVGCPGTVRDAAWSADGTLVATACSDGTARLWNPDTGALLHLLDAHSSNVTSVDISPDGTLVATGSSDDTSILWSTATGAVEHTLTGHSSTVTDVSFSPDGSWLATGSLDTDVVVWSTATGLEVDRLDHSRVINHLEYAPDGTEIAASAANDLVFWDATTLAEIDSFPVSGEFTYAPDGNRLVVLDTDWAGIIDRTNGAPLVTFSTNLNHNDVAYARNGSRVLVATNDRTTDLWSPFDRGLLQQFEQAATSAAVALSPNADRVLYASGGSVIITAADRSEPRTTLQHSGAQTSLGPIAFSPDGRCLLTSDNRYARMREIASDREVHWFGPASTGLTALAYSPSGTSVATAHGASVRLWATDSGDELHELLHSSAVRTLSFTPDGGVIAAGCDDGTIHLWNVASGAETMSPLVHGAQLSVVRFSPDGTLLASSATNQTVLVWSTTSGSQVATFAANSPYALDFSADSSRLYTGAFISFQRKLIEWEIATETELRRWDLGNYDFALAPDGRHAAIGTAGSTVEIWNLDATTLLRELVGLSTRAEHVELSADGTVVAVTEVSGGTPHTVLWETGISDRAAVPIGIGETVSATAPHLLWTDFVIDLSSRAPTNLVATLTPGANREWHLLGRWGQLPTFAAFDWQGTERADGSVVMTMAAPPAGLVYVSVWAADWSAGGTAPFGLSVLEVDRYLASISPSRGGNTGATSTVITGLGLEPGLDLELRDGPTALRRFSTTFVSSQQAQVILDLAGLAPQTADVVAIWPDDGERALTDAFEIVGQGSSPLVITLEHPSLVRSNRPAMASLVVRNTGMVDMPAPLVQIATDPPVPVRLDGELEWQSGALTLLATDDATAPASRLAPDSFNSYPIEFVVDAVGVELGWSVSIVDGLDETIDWSAREASFRPQGTTDAIWQRLWPVLTSRLGTTWGDYRTALHEAADHLHSLGRAAHVPSRLIALIWNEILGAQGVPSLATVDDAVCPAPEVPLVFTRRYPNAMASHFRIGPFGYGWTHTYDLSLSADADFVAITSPAARRGFAKSGDSWRPASPAESGRLMESGVGWKLVERDGTVWEFTTAGVLSAVVGRHGNRVDLGYDGLGRLETIAHSSGDSFTLAYDTNGRVETLTDHAGRDTTYTYDPAGEHLMTVTAPGGVITSYTYEPATGSANDHALETVTDPELLVTTFAWDSTGRLASIDRESAVGPVQWSWDTPGTTTMSIADEPRLDLLWDEHGRVWQLLDPDGGTTRLGYDTDGWLGRAIDANGAAIEIVRGPLGYPIELVEPTGARSSRTVEIPVGGGVQLTGLTDGDGNTFSFERDAIGWIDSIVHPDLSSDQLTRNATGAVESITNRRGDTITIGRNARGQATSVQLGGDPASTMQYNPIGHLIGATDASGTVSLTWSGSDRYPERFTNANGHWVEVETDHIGRVTRRSWYDGFELTYSYDANGRLTSITDPTRAVDLLTYTYDSAGRVVHVDRSNGTATTYAYDALERVSEIVHLGPGDVVQASFTTTYDPAGNPIAIESLAGTTSYSYDAANRLTRVDFPDGSHFDYDYDDAGNRISTSNDTTSTTSTINQLNQVTSVGSDSYTWDADGNLTAVTGGTTISWDAVGRMTDITAGGATTTYGYDGFGNLASRTVGDTTTELLLDPGHGLTEIDDSGQVVARFVFGYGLACRIDASGDVLFYGFDPTDSTRLLTDNTGAVAATYDFTPWGELRTQTGSIDTPFRFAGRFGAFSDDHGLIRMGARWYQPTLGRFVSIEPERFAGGSNLYAYAGNNPVRWADPSGFGAVDHVSNGLAVAAGFIPEGAKVGGLPAGSVGSAATGMFGSVLGAAEAVDSFHSGELWGIAHGLGSIAYNQGGIAISCIAGSTELASLGVGVTTSSLMAPVATVVFISEAVLGDYTELMRGRSQADWQLEPVQRSNIAFLKEIYGDDPIPEDVLELYGLSEGPESVASQDPNEKLGPAGLGGQRVVSPNSQHAYTVYFENLASATAPAQEVLVTDQLDRNLDWSTIQLTEIAWGDTVLPVVSAPPFVDRVTIADYRAHEPRSWWVEVAADLSPAGQLSWQLTMLDPATGELPSDPLAGFLPPNDGTGRGEGHIAFTIDQQSDLATGTEITNRASIVFDLNEAIITNTWSNTVSWGACDPNLDGWLDAGDILLLSRVLSDVAYVPPGNADCTEGGGETVDDLLWALLVMFN